MFDLHGGRSGMKEQRGEADGRKPAAALEWAGAWLTHPARTNHFTSFQYAAFRRHVHTVKRPRNKSTQTPI